MDDAPPTTTTFAVHVDDDQVACHRPWTIESPTAFGPRSMFQPS